MGVHFISTFLDLHPPNLHAYACTWYSRLRVCLTLLPAPPPPPFRPPLDRQRLVLRSLTMVLRIRLARFGTKRAPVYNIVLAQAKSARGKKPIEVLGTYDPIPRIPLASPGDTPLPAADGVSTSASVATPPKRYKDIKLDTARTKYWLGVGAQPTEPVAKLLNMIGLVEAKPSRTTQQKASLPEGPAPEQTATV